MIEQEQAEQTETNSLFLLLPPVKFRIPASFRSRSGFTLARLRPFQSTRAFSRRTHRGSVLALICCRIGYEAAALLDKMMAGKHPQHMDRYIEPLGIVPRRSTDTLVIPHAGAAQALSFLRRHFRDSITLKDLNSELPVSLRSVQDAFKKHVGRSLHQELDRLRTTFARTCCGNSA